LLATNSYKEENWFDTILKIKLFKHVEYFPSKNSIATHRYYNSIIPKLLNEFQPKAVLMHSEFFIDNLYLINFLKIYSPNTKRIYFQPARLGIDIRANTISRHYAQVDNIFQKFNLSTALYGCVSIFIHIRNSFSFFVNCYALPLIFIRKKFSPPVNYITGEILFNDIIEKENRADQYGVHINYLAIEAAANLEHGAANIILAAHPMKFCFMEVLQELHGDINVHESIFIAPTYGLTSILLANGIEPLQIISNLSEKWSSVIATLKEQFPSYQIKIKLHPEAFVDTIWNNILQNLTIQYPDLQIIDPRKPAEIYVARSKVVIGDISSVLWWASLLGGKVVISLDIFGYPGGDALKPYSDSIFYINNINQLKEVFELKNIKCIQDDEADFFAIVDHILE
jgi:hypothetical protein